MSDYARDAAWSTKGLTPMQRCILLAIAEECENSNESKAISLNALGGMCECSWRWVHREINKLQDRGVLQILNPSAGEGRSCNTYIIVHPDTRKEAEGYMPDEMLQKPKKKKEDPLWLKKKRNASGDSGGSSQERRPGKLASANGQSLVSISMLTTS